MTPEEIFETNIAGRLADPKHQPGAKEIDAVYQFNINGDDGGQWVVDMKECTVRRGEAEGADCTITVGSQDCVNLYEGQVQGPMLVMQGKLQFTNMGLAMKLGKVIGG